MASWMLCTDSNMRDHEPHSMCRYEAGWRCSTGVIGFSSRGRSHLSHRGRNCDDDFTTLNSEFRIDFNALTNDCKAYRWITLPLNKQ